MGACYEYSRKLRNELKVGESELWRYLGQLVAVYDRSIAA